VSGRTFLFALLACAALVVKLCLALFTFGTNDVLTFERMLDKLNSAGPEALYRDGTPATLDGKVISAVQMNHPPFVLTLLRFWDALRAVTGLPVRFWMRACCVMADLFVVCMLWNLVADWRAVLVVTVAPAAVMISGFHGNTDPIMIAFSVLAAYLLATQRPAWLAGAALGLSCSVKVWPLLLVPVLLLATGSLRRGVQFSLAAAAVALCAAMPWLAANPALIVHRVFDYAPVRGWWGVSYLCPQCLGVAQYAVFACTLAASVLMRGRVRSVIAQCAVVTAIFLFLAPGFGPQYLAWLVPWTCAAGWRNAALFHAASGAYLFGMYNTWSLGIPWYFGNAYNLYKVPFPPWVYPAGLVAWALLPLVAISAYRRYRTMELMSIRCDF
jgi:hypothetical protein